MKKKLIVIDGNSIVNRAFYGVRELNAADGLPTNAVYGTVSILEKHLDSIRPEYAAIAFDLHAPTFRHKMYDGYKATRHGMPEELAATHVLQWRTQREAKPRGGANPIKIVPVRIAG